MDEMETPLTMHERGVSGKPTAFDKLMQSPQWKAAKAKEDPETKHIFSDKERQDGAEHVVENLWSKTQTDELIKRLDGKSPVFITMPSTSRQNILPDVLAERLQKELGGTVLFGSDIASPIYAKEMKSIPHEDRPFVPREFVLYDPMKLRKDVEGKAVVVVEDVFSSGASAKAFCDTLKESKVQVQTVAGLLGDSRLVAEPQLVTKLQKTLKQSDFHAFKAKDISAVLSRGQINTLIDEINKTQSKEGQEKTDGQKRIAEGLQRIFDSRASRTIGQNIWRSEGGIESPPRNDDRNIDLGERLRSNTGSSDRGEIEAGNLRELHGSRLKAHQELRAQDTMIQSTGGASAYEKLAKDKAISIERQVYRLQAKAETLLSQARKDEQQLRANPPSRVKALLTPKVKINWQKRIEQAKRRADRAEKTIKGCETLKRDAARMKTKIDSAIARSATPEILAEHRRIEEEREKNLAEKRRQEEAKRLEHTKDMLRRLEAERTRGKQQGNTLGIGRERQI